MSGDTIEHGPKTASGPARGQNRTTVSPGRAARELCLRQDEFDIAVLLGHIRTRRDEGSGGRCVDRAEIERLRYRERFLGHLREQLTTVGTREGARLMGVTPTRFVRLARLGLVVPVTFRVTRNRSVVWRYPVGELRLFAGDPEHAALLRQPLPQHLRDQLDAGVDLRARNWRRRYLRCLLRQAEDAWERAACAASLLDPVTVSETVTDPCERARLLRLRQLPPGHGAPGSPTARLVERITTAQDADEIERLRTDLQRTVREARRRRPAPRHTGPSRQEQRPCAAGHGQRTAPHEPVRPAPVRHAHALLGRLLGTGDTTSAHDATAARNMIVAASARAAHRLRYLTAGAYTARNRPSWTTDTSRRPCRS
jgi:hypothetical protein